MTADFFLDTNILVYSISDDPKERSKHDKARELLSMQRVAVSAQVLSEFYCATTRKRDPALSHEQAVVVIRGLHFLPALPLDRPLVLRALDIRNRYQISYWDALIIAAAQQLGAGIVYSEDLNHGQNYNGVVVENPFANPTTEIKLK